MLIRRDQARRMLTLIHEGREIGAGEQQKLHLVAGIHRLLGAAMTSLVVLRNACDPRRRKIEQEMSTPADRNVRTMTIRRAVGERAFDEEDRNLLDLASTRSTRMRRRSTPRTESRRAPSCSRTAWPPEVP